MSTSDVDKEEQTGKEVRNAHEEEKANTQTLKNVLVHTTLLDMY